MSIRLLIAFIGVTLVPVSVLAQFGSLGGGVSSLHVQVVYPNDRPVLKSLDLELVSGTGTPITRTVTDSDGRANFNGVSAGDYFIEVTAEGFERTRSQTFTITRDERFHSETVVIQPEETGSQKAPAGSSQTVSAAGLKIPDEAKAEFRKAAEALDHNNLEESKKRFAKAVELYPSYSAAYDGLGIVTARMGDIPHAQEYLQKAVALDDHNARACINLSRLEYREGKLNEAETSLNKALLAEPKNVEALVLMANLQLKTGDYDGAIATESRIHQLPHEQYAMAHLIAARAYEHRQMSSQAAKEYELYLKESPNGPAAADTRARLEAMKKSP
jgi:tetratricopeptide (TPR) repeat protein